ncbi:competence/damage-inducible protein A [bacterium]|nr:competence/damage-inducible protein A [bacterium]
MKWNQRALKPAILSIGDELLFGEILNSNLDWLLKKFFSLSIPLKKSITIGDDLDLIALEISRLKKEDYYPIIVCGGLGGTHDDLTREAISKGLGVDFCLHPKCLDILQNLYQLEFNDQRKRMAILPKDCDLILNPLGAPGFHINGIYAFPGFPQMFKPMMEAVLDGEFEKSSTKQFTKAYVYQTTEGVIALDVDKFAQENPDFQVGIYGNVDSYLRETTVKVRYNNNQQDVIKLLEEFFHDLADKHQIQYQNALD